MARSLLLAVEPSFRGRLGDKATDRDFIGELYVGFWRALIEYPETEFCRPGLQQGTLDEFALRAYLVAASQNFGSRIDPELLDSLRAAISGVLTGADGTPAGGDPERRRDRR